jgi:hypothetical protein
MRPDADLVLEVAQEHGLSLPQGTALDDHLDLHARERIDIDASAWLAGWRERVGDMLTVDGLDLAHVWEAELLARCFQPAARLMHGLPRAVESAGAGRVLVPEGLADLARVTLRDAGVEAVPSARAADAPPPIPRAPRSRSAEIAGRTLHRFGVPPRIRGNALCVSYWHLGSVYTELALGHRAARPVASGLVLGNVGRGDAIRAALRYGWLGLPGERARLRSRADILRATAAAAGDADGALESALHRLAVGVIAGAGLDTLADFRHAQRAFRSGRVRLAVLPFDSPESARVVVGAAHAAGVGTLVVQHGFDSELGDPDMMLAAELAVWSERDRRRLRTRVSGSVTVTGNPGAAQLAASAQLAVSDKAARRGHGGRTVILVEYPSRMSARVDGRIGMRHVDASLAALAEAWPGSDAVIRPHPADIAPQSYGQLAATHPGVSVSVDAVTPVEALLHDADLCIGAVSTATLQALALGVPTALLDLSLTRRPWPFDGSPGALPRATDTGSLAEELTVLRRGDTPGREAAVEALGVRSDAVERVLAVIDELV